MQTLICPACESPVPLARPRLMAGQWFAQCTDCLADHRLEPISANVFLPQRFRVLPPESAPVVHGLVKSSAPTQGGVSSVG